MVMGRRLSFQPWRVRGFGDRIWYFFAWFFWVSALWYLLRRLFIFVIMAIRGWSCKSINHIWSFEIISCDISSIRRVTLPKVLLPIFHSNATWWKIMDFWQGLEHVYCQRLRQASQMLTQLVYFQLIFCLLTWTKPAKRRPSAMLREQPSSKSVCSPPNIFPSPPSW